MESKFVNPESKHQPHFKALIAMVVRQFAPLYIYQFAQVAQVERVNSVFGSAPLPEAYLYHLLIILQNHEVPENRVQAFANKHFTGGKVVVQVHGQDTLFKPGNPNGAYFAAIFNYGQLCYSNAGAPPMGVVQAPKPKKRLGRAIVHWRKHHQMANGFLMAARQAMANGHNGLSLYLLHLAVAEACLDLIYVFMGYQTTMCNLKQLLYTCTCFSTRPLQHFLATAENGLLLKVLMQSANLPYHEDDLLVKDKPAAACLTLVEGFLPLANQLCKVHFAALQKGVDAAKLRRREGLHNG